jgi:N-glycosylase/DNA lyase
LNLNSDNNPLENLIAVIESDKLAHLSLVQTMQSGQHFRSKVLDDDSIIVVNQYGLYRMKEDTSGLSIYGEHLFDYEAYFDMNRDYEQIQEILSRKDPHLEAAIIMNKGLRILQQDPFEMIMTFIISQSKQISQIKILVERLSHLYGDAAGAYKEVAYHMFPTPEQLIGVDEVIYKALKMGYRSRYLEDAVKKIVTRTVDLAAIKSMSYEKAKAELMQIKGVGEKVADCVLLFGYGRFEAFPVDVWIERIIGELYFDKKPSKKELNDFVDDYFGAYKGIAQQYLFEYARTLALGKNKPKN